MDFSFTDEQKMLADTLDRFLAERCGPEQRARTAYAAPFHDPALWSDLVELGLLGGLVGEEHGGFGGSGTDILAIFGSIGRALCPEPVLPALLGASALAEAGADLSDLLAGTRYALAVGEAEAPNSLDHIATRFEAGRLDGRKSVVYGGQTAERILIAARDGDRLGLFEAAARDCEITGYAMIDGGGAAEIVLDATPATCLIPDAAPALPRILDRGRLALVAEAVGIMDRIAAITLDYLRTRRQFGRAIGEFQVLQHRMVDLRIEIEQARSIAILAAARMGTGDAARTVAMAKSLIGRVGRMVAEEAIQMHGGIAMTWEYPVSHMAKRLVMLDAQLGDADHHLAAVARAYTA